MDENLIGYLLDALEPDERRAVEARLRSDPRTRARLATLRRALLPLEADTEAFDDKMERLTAELSEQMKQGQKLDAEIKRSLESLGFDA